MSDDKTDLQWLAGWYSSQADGVWEHDYGVTIDTFDNPGWGLRVDLAGTALLGVSFAPEQYEEGESWARFWKDDTRVYPTRLETQRRCRR